jgi:hypothetical protein
MACVSPPLLRLPSRGFEWACGPCSRAQELKLESRQTFPDGPSANVRFMGAHLKDYDNDHDTEDEIADALAKEENVKQVRFEIGRPEARAKERAETLFAAKEKQRAMDRQESRRRKEREGEPEPVKIHRDFLAAHRQEQQGKQTETLLYETEYAAPIDSLQQHLEDDDDAISVIPSVFSENSTTSSATVLSTMSGYSAGDIITASKELVSIFHEDETMVPLYKSALANPAIGPNRLERNLRRLSKTYSAHLEREATDQLEYLAAQLVALKARGLAESIVRKFSNSHVRLQAVDHEQYSDSSDDEANTYPVNEEALADLIAFRRFLVGSKAFTTLQVQLQAFVSPTPARPPVPKHIYDNGKLYDIKREKKIQNFKPFARKDLKSGTWHCWQRDAGETAYAYLCNSNGLSKTILLLYLLVDLAFLMTDKSLIATGLLEPPLCPTETRLRWSFVCVYLPPHHFKSGPLINTTGLWRYNVQRLRRIGRGRHHRAPRADGTL